MLPQPLAGFQGQATDIDIHAREILKTRDTLNELYAKHTGQPADKIKHDTERDNFMSSSQAKEYGIIDEVLITAKKKADDKKKTRTYSTRRSALPGRREHAVEPARELVELLRGEVRLGMGHAVLHR